MQYYKLSSYIMVFLLTPVFSLIMPSEQGCCAENYHPRTYAYVLQADKLNKNKSRAAAILQNSERDLIIIDPFFTNDLRWSRADIDTIRSGSANRKVIAYLSIGEAEDYRAYWLREWSDEKRRPAFIEEENPDWKGNFKVKYWAKEWHDIVLKELGKIAEAGFDGVFLDIIDGFEYFENDPDLGYIDYRINPETGNSYRADMISLVELINRQLNSGGGGYLIVPQNGVQLLESPLYQQQISLLALESLFTDDNSAQPLEYTRNIMNFVASVQYYNKSVLLTEYATKKKYLKYSRESAAKDKIILLQTNRDLSKLGTCYPVKQ